MMLIHSLFSFLRSSLAIGCSLLVLVMGCDGIGGGEEEHPSPPRPLTAAEKTVVDADQRFGLRLLRATVDAEEAGENVFVSPISVSMALGMTLNGARGETRTAMERALEKQNLSPDEINDAYRGLIDLLEGLDPNVEVSIANSIWYREDVSVKQAFIDTNRTHFDAEVAGLDFASSGAPDRMNDWVNEETNGTISKIVSGPISDDILMYLINATYFKGAWRTQFDPEKTEEGPFHLADGATVTVPMMKRTEEVSPPLLRTDQFTAVDLAYGDSLYSMTILLPREDASVRGVVDSLDAEAWTRITTQMTATELGRLKMPKFTLQYERKMRDVLTDLGMGVAFTEQANFRGIADTRLAIHKVKHKTFLQVDEEGTEASAVTSVSVGPTSAPPSVVVDRPFVVVIRENHSDTLLFTGVVMNPTSG